MPETLQPIASEGCIYSVSSVHGKMNHTERTFPLSIELRSSTEGTIAKHFMHYDPNKYNKCNIELPK